VTFLLSTTPARPAEEAETTLLEAIPMPDRDSLRRAVAAAQTGDELAAAVAALDSHDQQIRAQAAQSRELDLAGQHVARTLAPVPLFERHTAATDWLAEDAAPGDYKTAMISEASVWYQNLDGAVKADADEFREQLAGRVRTVASAYGDYAPAAAREFLSVIGYLHQGASGVPQIQQTVDPNNAPSTTPLPTQVFDNFAPEQNDYNGGVEDPNHGSGISSRTAPMLQQIEQQNGGGSGYGSGAELEDHHDTAFNPGMGYAEVPLGAPGTIPTAGPGAAPQAVSTPNPNEGVEDYDGSQKQGSYTPADPHGFRWVTGSREVMHPFHDNCGVSHWPGERCGGAAHTASLAIGYTGSLDDFRRTAQLELIGAEHGRQAVAAAAGPRQLAERYNQVMAGFEAQAASEDDTAVLHGFMAVVRPVLARVPGNCHHCQNGDCEECTGGKCMCKHGEKTAASRLDFPRPAAGIAPEAASSLPTEHQVTDPNNVPTPQDDTFNTGVMFPIDPAFAEQWETGPEGAQPKGTAKEAAGRGMTPPPGAAAMFGRMDAMEGKRPHHKDHYPFSKIQHGNYLRGWNETAGLTHGMTGRAAMSAEDYADLTGRPDLHQHYLSHYALGRQPQGDEPDDKIVGAYHAALRSLAGDSGTGVDPDSNRCSDCGHLPGCSCPHHCDNDPEEPGVRKHADYMTRPHVTTDDGNPPYNSAETTPDVPGSDADAGRRAGVADAQAGERPAFADSSSQISPYVKAYADGYSSVHLPPAQPDTPGSLGDDSGQAMNANEAATAFQVSKASLQRQGRDFTRAEREEDAKEGDALPDGKLPIKNKTDLENAEHLKGKVKGDSKAEVDAYMDKEERKFGKTSATTVDLVTDGPGTSPDPMGSTPINGPGTPPRDGGRGNPARSGGAPPYQGAAPLPGGPVVSDDVMGQAQEPDQPDGPMPMGFSGAGEGYGNQNLAPRAPNAADEPGYENAGAYDGDPARYQNGKAAAFRQIVQGNLAKRREGIK
jgi:hypothetical protein